MGSTRPGAEMGPWKYQPRPRCRHQWPSLSIAVESGFGAVAEMRLQVSVSRGGMFAGSQKTQKKSSRASRTSAAATAISQIKLLPYLT